MRVCVCVCVRLRVCIYITIHLFSPREAYGVGNAECGNSGTTIPSTIEKTMFHPIACARLWSQIENLWASSSNPKANKYWGKQTSPLSAHRASTTEKWRWLWELWWTCLDNRQQQIPVSVEEFKSTAEILRQYRMSWLTQATRSQNNTSQAPLYLQLKSCRKGGQWLTQLLNLNLLVLFSKKEKDMNSKQDEVSGKYFYCIWLL